jgi:hypothetical protein
MESKYNIACVAVWVNFSSLPPPRRPAVFSLRSLGIDDLQIDDLQIDDLQRVHSGLSPGVVTVLPNALDDLSAVEGLVVLLGGEHAALGKGLKVEVCASLLGRPFNQTGTCSL